MTKTDKKKKSNYEYVEPKKGGSGKKLSKTAIVIICVAAVVLLAGGGALTYFLMTKEAKTVKIDRLWIDNFNEETDFYFLIRWNSIKSASGYTVEYAYSLYNDENGEKTVLSYTTTSPGLRLMRKKGEFYYRVKPNFSDKAGEFTEWQTLEISAKKLENPNVTLNLVGKDLTLTVESVNYKSGSGDRLVYSYEIQRTVAYADTGEVLSTDSDVVTVGANQNYVEKMEDYTDLFTDEMVFTVKVRSLNVKKFWFNSETGGLVQREDLEEREYLYDIYDINEEYSEKHTTVVPTAN